MAMSNSLAIAAVTAALYDILSHAQETVPGADSELADTIVTTKAPDLARATEDNNQLNIFLYQTLPCAALRNQKLPNQTRPGERATPALALNLMYLITAYGKGGDDLLTHRLLGRAMSLLYDHTVLDNDLLTRLVSQHPAVTGNDLSLQVERVRITPQTLNLEEMSKLWTMLQAKYRISAAYEVSVVLIESTRPIRAALPVLARGAQDRGALLLPSAALPYPVLRGYTLANNKPAGNLGVSAAAAPSSVGLSADLPSDSVTLLGDQLAGSQLSVSLAHPLHPTPYVISSFALAENTQVTFSLPNDQQGLPAGIATVFLQRTDSGSLPDAGTPRTTNVLPLPIAPRLLQIQPASVTQSAPGTLTVTCSPAVLPQQRVGLLIGSQEVLPTAVNSASTTLSFDLSKAALQPGSYPLRLRVDGIDSQIVDYTTTPPSFLANLLSLVVT